MKADLICAYCDKPFTRAYRISAARADRPQYCSPKCMGDASRRRADATRNHAFWAKVDVDHTDECWPWLGMVNSHGYGIWGRTPAPRVAYQLFHHLPYRSLKPDQFVCHSCDNPRCCNPYHLWLGTHAENMADMDRKGRRGHPVPRRGEKSNKAKLTAEQAIEIYKSSTPAPAVAAQYGITKTAVYLIRSGKNWAHVTGAKQCASA